MKKITYPPGPGITCIDRSRENNIISTNPSKYLQDTCKTQIQQLFGDLSTLETGVKDRKILAIILEICFRYMKSYISIDKIWIEYL